LAADIDATNARVREQSRFVKEALRVLDILREQQRLQPEPARQPGSGQGLDD